MPTPIGHSLISTAIFAGAKKKDARLSIIDYFVFLFIGMAPDLDFIPGYLIGEPSRYHHGLSHSLFMSVFIGIITGFVYYLMKRRNFVQFSVIFSGVYFAHVSADFFAVDTSFPFGEQLFWPVWNAYLLSPVTFFLDVHRSTSSHDFFMSMFNSHNLKTVTVEMLICLPIILGVYFFTKFKEKNQASSVDFSKM